MPSLYMIHQKMKYLLPFAIGALFTALFVGCANYKPYYHPEVAGWEANKPGPNQELDYTIFLLGDAGEPREGGDPNFKLFGKQLEEAEENSFCLFLGDNIYPVGMVNKGHALREESERRIDDQIALLNNFKGGAAFIPGNHDWEQGGKNGLEHLKNQEKYIEKHTNRDDIFLPENGCPGPVEVILSPELALIIIDTQWWLHPHEKPKGKDSPCDARTGQDMMDQLADLLDRNRDKKLIVAGHHPVYSHGTHMGRYTLKDHLFPLTALNHNLYIPFPIIGSIYPLYRSVMGNIQDIPHPRNQELREKLTEIFLQHPNIIYADGHEHSLEYSTKDSVHFIVSGAGSKNTPTGKSKVARYVDPQEGFSRLDYYKNGDVWLTFWSPYGDNEKGKITFRKKLFNKPNTGLVGQKDLLTAHKDLNFSGQIKQMPSSGQYEAKALKNKILGSNYRKEWGTSVDVPYLDLGTERGGLNLIKRGGGQQTRSLRLQAPDGKQYVLRSVDKFSNKLLPGPLRGTFAQDLVQDQISSSHPLGFLTVPKMAEAAKVYHTNPQIVYIPDDPRFGRYKDDFKGLMCLYEERANGDWSDADFFGNSSDIIGTPDLLEELKDDNDNFVDQQWVLRSRLFDLVIGDFDRHEDQWRWASFEVDKGKMFRPIPRDRDQTYFRGKGPVMWLVSRSWAIPKLQPFDGYTNNVPGHIFNGAHFDRSFLNGKSWPEWQASIDSLQLALTDEVFERGLKDWPQEIYDISAKEVFGFLKTRRDTLESMAREQYLFLAKEVEVVGSDKNEFFKILRMGRDSLRVDVYKLKEKDGSLRQQLYSRVFYAKETKEIRLFGRGDDDIFQFEGEGPTAIRIRIIGGEGKDEIVEMGKHNSGKDITVYDQSDNEKNGIIVPDNNNYTQRLSPNEEVNEYDRKSFKYDISAPAAYIGFNIDDGIFLGGGVLIKKHAWRRAPFASQHLIAGNLAFRSNSFNFRYKGIFHEMLGEWGLKVNLEANVPRFNNTFFGLGNETTIDPEKELSFYWTQSTSVHGGVGLVRNFSDKVAFHVTPSVQFIKLEQGRNAGRFIADPTLNGLDEAQDREVNETIYENRAWAGAIAGLTIDETDNKFNPHRGIRLKLDARHFRGLQAISGDYTQLSGKFSLYIPFNPIRTVWASQIGGAINYGQWEFYQAPSVGLLNGLRGYRNNRFTGKTAAFVNTEVRTNIGKINLIVPITVGSILFYDQGRVSLDGEESDTWHRGYGAGIWLAPLNAIVVSVAYAMSEENPLGEGLFVVRLGFGF